MTKRAPARAVAHFNERIHDAGGTVADSRAGSLLAAHRSYDWIDNNGHLTSDLRWVNAHGSPFNPDGLVGKFENHTAAELHVAIPGLRSAFDTFRDNASLGLDTEWEVKDVHPLVSDSDLTRAFARLRYSARKAYGPDWQQHVQVKVLTNLRGGLRYARRICKFAHAAGFDTIILRRGVYRLMRLSAPYITYRR
jgi:hypothetical protein